MQPFNLYRNMLQRENDLQRKGYTYIPKSFLKRMLSYKDAPKFLLPESGMVWNETELKNLPEHFQLPYPKMLLEFERYLTIGEIEILYKEGEDFGVNPENDQWSNTKARCLIMLEQTDEERIRFWQCGLHVAPTTGEDIYQFPFYGGELVTRKFQCTGYVDLPYKAVEIEWKNAWPEESKLFQERPDLFEVISQLALSYNSWVIYAMLEMLSFRNVETNLIPARKLNKGAAKRKALPFDDYKILVVQPTVPKSGNGFGTHRSPREHIRRGHVRTYRSGKTVFVAPMVVNPGVGGKIFKHYQLKDGK